MYVPVQWGDFVPVEFTSAFPLVWSLLKVRSFEEDSCAILISFKRVVIFSEIKTKSAKMTAHLKEMRIDNCLLKMNGLKYNFFQFSKIVLSGNPLFAKFGPNLHWASVSRDIGFFVGCMENTYLWLL